MEVTTAVVLAGGRGTRLGAAVPKPLVAVCGIPIVERQLRELADAGVKEVFLTTGYGADEIEAALGDGTRFGLRLHYVREDKPLGTAGGVAALTGKLPGPFYVIYGDVLFHMDLRRLAAFHASSGAMATLVVHPNDHPYDSDLVSTGPGGRVDGFFPKPRAQSGPDLNNCVSAALYVLDPAALAPLAPWVAADFVRDLFPALLSAGQPLFAYNTTEYLKDMGTPDRLLRVEQDLRSGTVAARHLSQNRPAVFLDRDGVLNEEIGGVHNPEALRLLPGAAAAVRKLNQAGYLVCVVTNQPDVAKGRMTTDDVHAVHRRLHRLLGDAGAFVDDIAWCPHHPDSGFPGEVLALKVVCACRKPAPGMVVDAVARLPIDPARSVLIGDSWRDIGAARAAGIRAIGVGLGPFLKENPDDTAVDLADAVDRLLARQETGP